MATQLKNCHLELIPWLSSKIITTTSDNSITLLSQNIPRWMSLLLDAVVIFFSSIRVLTPNGQFLDYAIIAYSQQYVSIIVNPPQNTNISFN
jgi:hypothetical protein